MQTSPLFLSLSSNEYVFEVKGIVKANAELRSLLTSDLLGDIARNTTQLLPGFDVETYRNSLQSSYGYLKLYTLDSSDRADAIKLWAMFITGFDSYQWLQTLVDVGVKEDVRADWVWTIGAYYKSDPSTLPYLKKLVHNSHCCLVQCAAIYAIGREFKGDPETFAYLKSIATKDPDEQLRAWAQEQLKTIDLEKPKTD